MKHHKNQNNAIYLFQKLKGYKNDFLQMYGMCFLMSRSICLMMLDKEDGNIYKNNFGKKRGGLLWMIILSKTQESLRCEKC